LLARLLPQAYKRLNDEKFPMQNRGL
jgi:hypothetical protein